MYRTEYTYMAHKLHAYISEKLPQWSVVFAEGEISYIHTYTLN